MNGLPYYRAYPRDFIEGTVGMPFELKAAYRLVLDLIYMQGGRLPDDAQYIAGLLGCSVRKWKALREALLSTGKIEASGGHLTNERADKELEWARSRQSTQRENRSGARKNNGLREPRSDHTESDTDTEEERDKAAADPTSPHARAEPPKDAAPPAADAETTPEPCVLGDRITDIVGSTHPNWAMSGALVSGWRAEGIPDEVMIAAAQRTRARCDATGSAPPSHPRYLDGIIRDAMRPAPRASPRRRSAFGDGPVIR